MGQHFEVLSACGESGHAALLELLTGLSKLRLEVTQPVVDSITEDFNLGLDHVRAAIDLKTAFAATVPFALCGLAHPDQDRAQDLRRRLIASFDAQPSAALRDCVTL
eukprot:12159641-Alexandrium_andersonii.AAC.1